MIENSGRHWTRYLNNDTEQFSEYLDVVSIRLEELVGETSLDYMRVGYDLDTSKVAAITVLAKQMLKLQYELSPEYQKSMTLELFMFHPLLVDVRLNLINILHERNMSSLTRIKNTLSLLLLKINQTTCNFYC